MKINSIYIAAFGGIKNLKLDFSNGFNVVFGENEHGKTTIMSFIKMMFYGSGRSTSQISKNLRKKYTPWDGSTMSGSISFESGGRLYRLEREFFSSDSKDKVTLYDLDLGNHTIVGAEPGVEILDLSAAAFERSVFIGQFGFPESNPEAEGELNSRLSNIALTGDETVSYEAVKARIEKAKNTLMSKSGKSGEYDKNLIKCNELKERIIAAETLKAEGEKRKNEILRFGDNIKRMQRKALELKEQISEEQEHKNAEKYALLLNEKAELDKINQQLILLDGSVADENYVRKIQLCNAKYQGVKSKLASKENEIEMLDKSLSLREGPETNNQTVERLQKETEDLGQALEASKALSDEAKQRLEGLEVGPKGKAATVVLLIIGMVLSLLAAVIFVSDAQLMVMAVAILVFGITGVVTGIILKLFQSRATAKRNEEKKANEKILSDAQEKITALNNELLLKRVKLESITAALNTNSAVYEKQQQMLTEYKGELCSLKSELECEEGILLELLSKYRADASVDEVDSCIEELSQKTALQKSQKQRLGYILNDLNGISYEAAQEKLEKLKEKNNSEDIDFDALKTEYDALCDSITEGKAQLSADAARLKAELEKIEDTERLKGELSELIKITAEQKEFCTAAQTALDVLLESFAQVRRSFGSQLEKKAVEILGEITEGRYDSMQISKSFGITVTPKDTFGNREIDFLSNGTADQAYLSLRLAMAQLMCQDETLPILLDDNLAQYDDSRVALATAYLGNYSKEAQVIMFTCHGYISDKAGQNGARIIKIKE